MNFIDEGYANCRNEEDASMTNPPVVPQKANRSDSSDNTCSVSAQILRKEPTRSRSTRCLQRELTMQLQANAMVGMQTRHGALNGSSISPPFDGEKIQRHSLTRSLSSSTVGVGGLFSPTMHDTVASIVESPSLVGDYKEAVQCVSSNFRMHPSQGQHIPLRQPKVSESMSRPIRSVARSQSEYFSRISQKSTTITTSSHVSSASIDVCSQDDNPAKLHVRSRVSSKSSFTSRRWDTSSYRDTSLISVPVPQSQLTCGEETIATKSKPRSHKLKGVSPRRTRERGDSSPSIPVRRTQSETSSDEESPRNIISRGGDDRWDSDSTNFTTQRSESTASCSVISETTMKLPSQRRTLRSQSLIVAHREKKTVSTVPGLGTYSKHSINGLKDTQCDTQLLVQGNSFNDAPVKPPESSPEREKKELSRNRRLGVPRISKSFSLMSRTNEKYTEAASLQDCKPRKQSPSLTSMFRKRADVSLLSPTQRTASTASTEQSNISYDSPVMDPPTMQPESGTMSTSEIPFGSLFASLKNELDNPLVTQSDRDQKILIQPPSGRCGILGELKTSTQVEPLHGVESPDEHLSNQAVCKKGVCSSKRQTREKESGVGPENTVLKVEVMPLKTCRRRVPLECKRCVDFGTVTIREYARSVGDNPSVGAGTPIGLGWAYFEATVVDVDTFEARVRKPGPRTRKDFYLTPQKRFHLLFDDWGYSVQEISDATKVASEIRKSSQICTAADGKLESAQDRWDATPAITEKYHR